MYQIRFLVSVHLSLCPFVRSYVIRLFVCLCLRWSLTLRDAHECTAVLTGDKDHCFRARQVLVCQQRLRSAFRPATESY